MASVIVFGPTGQAGSAAARTAAEHGAKVWLAMRDTNKAIPSLPNAEKPGAFERVQADLQKPDTVREAVKTSGAKRAFVYLAHGSSDNMKGTFEALKTGGAEFVVFLSSFTIPTDKSLREIPQSEYIPYVHAQAEANLDDVFGDNYVALRPGAFITNLMQYQKDIVAGEVPLYSGEFQQDNVTPVNIGQVAGTVLVSGPRNGQKKVYIYGPQPRSVRDSILAIGKTLGQEIKLTPQSAEEAFNTYTSFGMPDFAAKYMVDVMSNEGRDKGGGELFPNHAEGVNNVKLYTGKPSMNLEDWVKENKALFAA